MDRENSIYNAKLEELGDLASFEISPEGKIIPLSNEELLLKEKETKPDQKKKLDDSISDHESNSVDTDLEIEDRNEQLVIEVEEDPLIQEDEQVILDDTTDDIIDESLDQQEDLSIKEKKLDLGEENSTDALPDIVLEIPITEPENNDIHSDSQKKEIVENQAGEKPLDQEKLASDLDEKNGSDYKIEKLKIQQPELGKEKIEDKKTPLLTLIESEKNSLEDKLIEALRPYFTKELCFLNPPDIDFTVFYKKIKETEEIHQKLLFFYEEGHKLSQRTITQLAFYYYLTYRSYEGIRIIEAHFSKLEEKDYFYNVLGNLYFSIGAKEQAKEYFIKSIQSTESLLSPHFAIGHLLFQESEFDDALKHLTIAEKHFIDNPLFLFTLAQCYEAKEQLDQALFYYEKYISTQQNKTILKKVIDLSYDLIFPQKALNYFDKALELEITIKNIKYKKALCYFLSNQLELSIVELSDLLNETQLDKSEDQIQMLFTLIKKAYHLGIYDHLTFHVLEAIAKKLKFSYYRMLEKDFQIEKIADTKVLIALAKQAYKQQKAKTSAHFLRKILTINKRHTSALAILGKLYYFNRKHKIKGIKIFYLLEKMKKTDGEIDFCLGKYYFEQENWKESVRYFERAFHKKYISYDLFESLGECHLKLLNRQPAIQYFQQAYDLEANHPRLMSQLGKLYLEDNKYQKAIKFFKQILEKDKDNKEVHLLLSNAYKLVLKNKSEKHYSQYQELN